MLSSCPIAVKIARGGRILRSPDSARHERLSKGLGRARAGPAGGAKPDGNSAFRNAGIPEFRLDIDGRHAPGNFALTPRLAESPEFPDSGRPPPGNPHSR